MWNPFAILFEMRKKQLRQQAMNQVKSSTTVKTKPMTYKTPKDMARPLLISDMIKSESAKVEEPLKT